MRPMLAAALVFAAAPPLSQAQPIRVLTLDSSRTRVCQTLDFNILTGNAFAEVRAALEDDANFGAGGVVPRDIQFVAQAPELTGDALTLCDIVLLSMSAVPLDVCERQALRDFVEQGGGAFVFENLAGACAGPILGVVPGGPGSGNGEISDPSNPVADGPFGPVSGALLMSFHSLFADVGPDGAAFAESDGPFAASFEIGAGRVVLYNDEESFMTQRVNGCAAGQLTSKERTLFLNAVAYVAPPPGFQFVSPGSCCLADTDRDGAADTRDVLRYLNDWAGAKPLADFNCDGVVNTQDVIAFLNTWASGC